MNPPVFPKLVIPAVEVINEASPRKDIIVNVVETYGLRKRYGSFNAVDQCDIHIEKGAIYGFIGRNGAGKSTAMKMIAGLIQPTEGEIKLFGQSSTSPTTQRIGVLIENPGIYPQYTALQNMMLKALALGVPDPKKSSKELLNLVGLSSAASRKSKNFSMGMKQRLGLALALLADPELLLLDEPMNGLDPEGAREIRELIVRLNKERSMTVMVSSHILDQLGRMATTYGVIRRGTIVRELSAAEVEEECTDYLVLKTAEPSKTLTLLQERFPGFNSQMSADGIIRIFGILDTAEVGSALASANIPVLELYLHKSDIEDYFVKMMGDESHA